MEQQFPQHGSREVDSKGDKWSQLKNSYRNATINVPFSLQSGEVEQNVNHGPKITSYLGLFCWKVLYCLQNQFQSEQTMEMMLGKLSLLLIICCFVANNGDRGKLTIHEQF